MRREINILAMAKRGERFIFLYDDQSYDALLELIDHYAENPELSLTAGDAAILSQKARESRGRRSINRYLS